jgi:hypothetical protein
MERHYVFDMHCPSCGRPYLMASTYTAPHVNCGECLMDRAKVVELKIVNVSVITGPIKMPTRSNEP